MSKLFDLSVTVSEATMSPPSTDLRVELTRYNRGPGFWQVTAVSQSLHTGSHIDAPLHCYEDGLTTAEIPLDRVIGRAVVLDCTAVEESAPVGVAELEAAVGPAAMHIGEGDIILLRTDWADHWYGTFPDYFTRSPYLTAEAAEWLVARKPRAVGFDFFEEHCARLPDFTSEDFVCHRILLGAEIPMLEGIQALGSVGKPRFSFYAPFYKLAGCDGAPARFVGVDG